MNRTVMIGLAVLAAVVIAAGSFYGGMVYGESQAESSVVTSVEGIGFAGRRGQLQLPPGAEAEAELGQFAGRQGNMLFGEIQSIGAGQLTVTDPSGEQITVYVADTTLIQKQAEVTLADLVEGETVVISGNRDEDGNITARSLQVSQGGAFFGQPGVVAPGGD